MTWLRTSGPSLLLSISLSFALWAFVSFTVNPETSTSFEGMPVYVQDLASNLTIVDQNGLSRPDQTVLSQVDVHVKTDQATLSGLKQQHLRAFVDVDNLSPGDHQIKVHVEPNRSDLRMSNFSSIQLAPEFLSVRLEQIITRTVPLTIEVEGNLPFSFEQSGPPEASVNNRTIQHIVVEGPQSRVEHVDSARAIANIEQLRASYVSSLQLTAYDANEDPVEGVALDPPIVKVRVPIRSVVGLKRVPILGTIVGEPASGYMVSDIQSDPPLINITGSSRRLDDIDQIETTPVDITNATTVITHQANLILPPGVSRHFSEESQVLISVYIEAIPRPFQVELPFAIDVIGASTGLIVYANPPLLHIPLSGFVSSLAKINISLLNATVNVSGLGPGSHTLTPQLSLPDEITVVGDIPTVEVTLYFPDTPTPMPTATLWPTPTASPFSTPTTTFTVPTSPTLQQATSSTQNIPEPELPNDPTPIMQTLTDSIQTPTPMIVFPTMVLERTPELIPPAFAQEVTITVEVQPDIEPVPVPLPQTQPEDTSPAPLPQTAPEESVESTESSSSPTAPEETTMPEGMPDATPDDHPNDQGQDPDPEQPLVPPEEGTENQPDTNGLPVSSPTIMLQPTAQQPYEGQLNP